MKTVSARLRWTRPSEGGREGPPSAPPYVTVSRFEQQRDTWEQEAWSLVVEWSDPPDDSWAHQVVVRFLVENAPEELLESGNHFELLEGKRVVAIGEVV